MFLTIKYDVFLSEWEVIEANSVVEVLDMDYSGFVAVRYKGNEFYLHREYFVELPSLVSNF